MPQDVSATMIQLRTGMGDAAELSSDEQGIQQLHWMDVVPRLLAHPDLLEQVEQEGRCLWERGIRHIIWSGMGGSITIVKTLVQMGICTSSEGIRLYLLDSTDPAALNVTMTAIAQAKGMPLPERGTLPESAWLRWLLEDVLLIGVSMSKTSEEPITHLSWFLDLLVQAYLPITDHVQVMTVEGSALEQCALERGLSMLPLFLDGKPLVGRMSAPGSRIFLLPVALHFAHSERQGFLRAILRQAWEWHDLDGAASHPDRHPFIQLASALWQASSDGICRLLLTLPEYWRPLLPWVEQLMEQSLGKGGKGVVVFADQSPLTPRAGRTLRVCVGSSLQVPSTAQFQLVQPYLLQQHDPQTWLAAVAATCLGWQLTMALYATYAGIPFATEPTVEDYKRLARFLRDEHDWKVSSDLFKPQERSARAPAGNLELACSPLLLQALRERCLTQQIVPTPAALLSEALRCAQVQQALYLDLTINGMFPSALYQSLEQQWQAIGRQLGIPVKIRTAPSCYHISEQAQLDGPPLVSVRLLLRDQEAPCVGTFSARFLTAQAVATWRTMIQHGRPCFLVLVDTGSAATALESFFREVMERLVVAERGQNV